MPGSAHSSPLIKSCYVGRQARKIYTTNNDLADPTPCCAEDPVVSPLVLPAFKVGCGAILAEISFCEDVLCFPSVCVWTLCLS